MSRKIEMVVANPAGNTTLMVTSPVEIADYQEVANKLLEIDFGKEYGVRFTKPDSESVMGEQVEFLLPDVPGELPAMNMCGLEFCGNASRSFAYYRAAVLGEGIPGDDGRKALQVRVSGCSYPLAASIDAEGHSAQIQMPTPVNVIELTADELGLKEENPELDKCLLLDLDGISHLVLTGIEATAEKFERIRKYCYEKAGDMEAFGVMFLEKDMLTMTPVVYVRDVDTTYFEGSCASGTSAASCALALAGDDGESEYHFIEPAGDLNTIVVKKDGRIESIYLDGLMELSDAITVEL